MDGGQRRRSGQHRHLRESGAHRAEAEIVVRVALADIDRLQRLAAGLDRFGDGRAVRQGKAAVDQQRFGRA
jgi:hypothetical protein